MWTHLGHSVKLKARGPQSLEDPIDLVKFSHIDTVLQLHLATFKGNRYAHVADTTASGSCSRVQRCWHCNAPKSNPTL